MARFKVIAGDFGSSRVGQVLVGPFFRKSGQGFNMPVNGHSFKSEHIGTGLVQNLEIATEENLKKMGGAIGWGIAGAVALGPVGALAGVLAGGRSKDVTFVCLFKDGRKFLGSCNAKTFTDIQAACFVTPQETLAQPEKSVQSGKALAIVGALFVAVLILAFLMPSKHDHATTPLNATISQPAVEFASYMLAQDIRGALLDGRKSETQTPIDDLLGWAQLDWRTTSREYDSAYQANEIAADNDYKGKRILVSGTISAIDKDFVGGGYLTLTGSNPLGVHAALTESSMGEAASFRMGQKVNLVCNGSGRVIGTATLDKCELASDYIREINRTIPSRITEFLQGTRKLRKAAALPVATMYVTGKLLTTTSPCISDEKHSCAAEAEAISKDPEKLQAIEKETSSLLVSLGVE
jgi:hypothetical protein